MLTEAWLPLSRGFSSGGGTNPVGGRPVGDISIPERRSHRVREHHLPAASVSGKGHQLSVGRLQRRPRPAPQTGGPDMLFIRSLLHCERTTEFHCAPPEVHR